MKYVDGISSYESIDRIYTYLKNKNKRNAFYWILGYSFGLRDSDIRSLKVKDINKDIIMLIEHKNNKPIIIKNTIKNQINEYIKNMNDDDYLFPSRKKHIVSYISRQQTYRIMKDVQIALNLKENIGTHTLRKTYANINYDGDIKKTARLLNHSSTNNVLTYIGINPKKIKELSANE